MLNFVNDVSYRFVNKFRLMAALKTFKLETFNLHRTRDITIPVSEVSTCFVGKGQKCFKKAFKWP